MVDNSKIKVCIGLSGGVDSSVAALVLKQQGYDVFALFMQNWHDASTTLHGDCEWEEDRFVAELVARKIGIPFYFVDLSEEYRQRVVDYMFDEYEKGRTPNPDVLCNREIKFDAFLKCAKKLGADYVATGHYCRKETIEGPDGPVHRILAGTDPNKDQSYFLCQLTQEQLSQAMFPVGDIVKPEVRRLAHEADLPSADKKDSQGICFVGKVDLPTFLQQKLKPCEGDVVEVDDAYYSDNEQYAFVKSTLESLLKDDVTEVQMITSYVSEDKVSTQRVTGCPYDPAKIASLPDEDFLRLSKPVKYEIKFETETYRSGRKHIKKTRYKENPYGRIVGRHDGAQFYTIGQRKGLGAFGKPMYVIFINPESNSVTIGDNEELFKDRIYIKDINFLAEKPYGESFPCEVKIRCAARPAKAVFEMQDGFAQITFEEPQRAAAPGQTAAIYIEDVLIGGGIICNL